MASVLPLLIIVLLCKVSGHEVENSSKFPLVVSTWPFLEAVRAGWRAINGGLSSIDAVVEGCSACELLRCDGTVGPGGSPDENSESTIDALIMNGATMEVGAVAAMRYVKDGIKAARLVMLYTEHTMLAGDQASAFAISMGLPGPSNLSSTESMEKWVFYSLMECRVGDGPIAGSSAYADDEVGACGATGDGDIMMRFLPCYQVVESMRLGMEPRRAAKDAISRIAKKFPNFVGAVFAVDKNGTHAGACYGWTFQYSVRSPGRDDVEVITVYP